MSDYTPTTEEVRTEFVSQGWAPDGSLNADNDPAAFDRWLAAHDAEQQRIGAERALKEFADSLTKGRDPETDPRIFDPWDVADLARARVDRLEAGDED